MEANHFCSKNKDKLYYVTNVVLFFYVYLRIQETNECENLVCGFLFIFWLVILGRYSIGMLNDTEMVTTAVFGNWLLYFCFQLLSWEQQYSMYKMNNYIARAMTGGKNKQNQ